MKSEKSKMENQIINMQKQKFELKRQPILYNRHQNFMHEHDLESRENETGPDDGSNTPEMLGPKLRKRFINFNI